MLDDDEVESVPILLQLIFESVDDEIDEVIVVIEIIQMLLLVEADDDEAIVVELLEFDEIE